MSGRRKASRLAIDADGRNDLPCTPEPAVRLAWRRVGLLDCDRTLPENGAKGSAHPMLSADGYQFAGGYQFTGYYQLTGGYQFTRCYQRTGTDLPHGPVGSAWPPGLGCECLFQSSSAPQYICSQPFPDHGQYWAGLHHRSAAAKTPRSRGEIRV
jgi:hypothetical protein